MQEGTAADKLLQAETSPFKRICTQQDALRWSIDVVSALAELHACSVIHRDLKLENLMLTKRNGNVHAALIDFGLCTVRMRFRLSAHDC